MQCQRIAGAQYVILRDRSREYQFVRAGISSARIQATGVLLSDGDINIDLITGAGNRLIVQCDFGEIAETIEPNFGALNLALVVPRCLKLTQFATNHLVSRLGVARHVDAAHVNAAARIDDEIKRDDALLTVNFRHRIDARKGVALSPQAVTDCLGAIGQSSPRKHFTGLNPNQCAQLCLRHQQITRHRDGRHIELRALANVDGDEYFFFVRRQRNLSRLDVKFEVAAVGVVAANRFQISLQFLLRILIVFGVPGQPSARRELYF